MSKCLLCSYEFENEKNDFFDTRFGIKEIYRIGVCKFCKIEQTIPILSPPELKNLYENHYNFSGDVDKGYTELRERILYSKIYNLWLAIDGDISFHSMKGPGKLLDIGCNEGRGLTIFQRNGFQVEGLELNEKAVNIAKSKGFVIHFQNLEQFNSHAFYDVVVLSNVLEHSPDPRNMLNQVWRLLESRGVVWISCPNSKSWLRYLFGRFWINWHVPFHIVHFTPVALGNLLMECGYKNIQIKQETPALWVAHSIIAFLFSKQGKPTLQLRNRHLIVVQMFLIRGVLFPFLWVGNLIGRGDCLVVTANKE